jgi:hypothetical protein
MEAVIPGRRRGQTSAGWWPDGDAPGGKQTRISAGGDLAAVVAYNRSLTDGLRLDMRVRRIRDSLAGAVVRAASAEDNDEKAGEFRLGVDVGVAATHQYDQDHPSEGAHRVESEVVADFGELRKRVVAHSVAGALLALTELDPRDKGGDPDGVTDQVLAASSLVGPMIEKGFIGLVKGDKGHQVVVDLPGAIGFLGGEPNPDPGGETA